MFACNTAPRRSPLGARQERAEPAHAPRSIRHVGSRPPPSSAFATVVPEASRRLLARLAAGSGWASAGIGLLALLGWVAHVPVLTQVSPAWNAVRISTAVSFILCGLALVVLSRGDEARRQRRAAIGVALLVSSSGLWAAGESLAGVAPSVERALGALLRRDAAFPGHVSPFAAFSFALAGLSLVGLGVRGKLAAVSRACAVLTALTALLVLIVYAYGDIALRAVAPLSSMAAPTALGFLLLGGGVSCAWGAEGSLAVLLGDGLGSVLARRGLPLALGLPLLAGWLTLAGGRVGLFEVDLCERQLELQRSNQDLEQFAYVASHDLQEPLRAVAGCGQILERRYAAQLEPAAQELIEHMVQGAARMQALILDLLAFSRVGAHELAPLDSAEVLAEALRQLQGGLEESRAELTIWVESRLGRGSTFHFTLPAEEHAA